MESGKYISWFSSTFSAVSFFSEPIVRGKDRERIRKMELRAVTDYHLLLHHKEEYPLEQLIGLIHTVINTLISLVVIDSDSTGLCIWTHLI